MMITAHKKTHGKRIPSATKCAIALQAISQKQTTTELSKRYNCSRTTVYQQKNRALEAANKAFEEKSENVLFYIPVTNAFIHMVIIALFLICGSSYRGIMFFLEAVLDYTISLGSVFNVIDAAADKAKSINESYDLSAIQTSAADELYHRNKPILSVVDIDSRFCALLAKATDRDQDTWGIHLLDLQERGYAPLTSILDGAKGLIKGHEIALPDTILRHDQFHFISDLKDCGRFLKNQVASSTTTALKLFNQKEKARNEQKKQELSDSLLESLAALDNLEETHETFKLLAQWLQHDVLQLAGHNPQDRTMLYDFIVSEMTALAEKHPHRINDIVTSLNHQRDALLGVSQALNDAFTELAKKFHVSIETLWAVCYTARYGMDSCKYNERSYELESLVGEQYDEIEDEVLLILEKTHRCSSMVENLNSRVRPYLDERKSVSQKILNLIQFYLNHKPFMRSQHERLVDKTPAQALTGKQHKPWLQMLGFESFKGQAA
jgi:hypothetical protein